MSVDNYLMGIAEIFNGWHVDAWKSLIVPCRNNLFKTRENFEEEKKSIYYYLLNNYVGIKYTIDFKNAGQQVFRCVSLHDNKIALDQGKTTNSATAVAATENQFLVDKNYNIIDGNIYSELCQKQEKYPYFNGLEYEAVGHIVAGATSSRTAYYGCYSNLDPDIPVVRGTDDKDFENSQSLE